MAAGKSSFVLYTDYDTIFEQLTDEEAGQLIKHLFRYVNDKEPEIENRMLRILFEPIKKQLKRDLKKWDKALKRKSDGGKKGMASRWKDNIPKDTITTDKIVKDTLTPITDTVIDTVTVTDNVNGTVILYRIEECLQISLNDERWVKANKTNRDELEVFNGYLEQVSEYTKNPKDYKSHFARFKRKYPEKVKAESKPISIEEFRRLAKEQDKTSAV